MTLRWNAKAESANTIIMWMGSLLAVLIVIVWMGKNIYPTHLETQLVGQDLESLQYEFSSACNSYMLNRSFNPRSDAGLLVINESRICITSENTYQCKQIICNTNHVVEHDLSNLTYLKIYKSPNGSIFTVGEE